MCAGGIIGLGEGPKDRVGLIHQLATLPVHPESVPINSLVAIAGTPMEGQTAPTGLDMARCIATARITMPKAVVRLSAGRLSLSTSDQVKCYLPLCLKYTLELETFNFAIVIWMPHKFMNTVSTDFAFDMFACQMRCDQAGLL